MRSRRSARAGAAVGVAAAVVLAGATSAAAAPPTRPEAAFALAGQGVLDLGPLVKITAPDGKPVHAELLGLSSVPGLAAAGISGGLLSSDARAGYASTSVANLKLAALLSGDVITTTCENGRGKVEIVNGSVLGTALPQFPVTGQSVPLAPLARVTLGEEKRNADGSITVTGIRISLLPGGLPGTSGLPGLGGAAAAVPVVPAAFATVDDEGDEGDEGDRATRASRATRAPTRPSPVPPRRRRRPRQHRSAGPRHRWSPACRRSPVCRRCPACRTCRCRSCPLRAGRCRRSPSVPPRAAPSTGSAPSRVAATRWRDDTDEPSSDDADDAPAPDVVEAELPVTG